MAVDRSGPRVHECPALLLVAASIAAPAADKTHYKTSSACFKRSRVTHASQSSSGAPHLRGPCGCKAQVRPPAAARVAAELLRDFSLYSSGSRPCPCRNLSPGPQPLLLPKSQCLQLAFQPAGSQQRPRTLMQTTQHRRPAKDQKLLQSLAEPLLLPVLRGHALKPPAPAASCTPWLMIFARELRHPTPKWFPTSSARSSSASHTSSTRDSEQTLQEKQLRSGHCAPSHTTLYGLDHDQRVLLHEHRIDSHPHQPSSLKRIEDQTHLILDTPPAAVKKSGAVVGSPLQSSARKQRSLQASSRAFHTTSQCSSAP